MHDPVRSRARVRVLRGCWPRCTGQARPQGAAGAPGSTVQHAGAMAGLRPRGREHLLRGDPARRLMRATIRQSARTGLLLSRQAVKPTRGPGRQRRQTQESCARASISAACVALCQCKVRKARPRSPPLPHLRSWRCAAASTRGWSSGARASRRSSPASCRWRCGSELGRGTHATSRVRAVSTQRL